MIGKGNGFFGKVFAIGAVVTALLVCAACESDSYSVFSRKYHVFFTCNTTDVPYNQLTVPGHFLCVRMLPGKLIFTDGDGNSSQTTLSQAQTASYCMGLAGLILGIPYFDNDTQQIWAYDLGCPKCDKESARLTIDELGSATCPKCSNTWDLNSSGYPTSGKKIRPLYRYPVSASGTAITVSN